jgi:hypothetical protein
MVWLGMRRKKTQHRSKPNLDDWPLSDPSATMRLPWQLNAWNDDAEIPTVQYVLPRKYVDIVGRKKEG